VAIIGIVSVTSMPLLMDTMTRNDLNVALTTAAQATRRANLLSRAAEGDRMWGIHFENSNIAIYKCPASGICEYLGRNAAETDYDENFSISNAISFTGTTEYQFAKISGTTTAGITTFNSGSTVKDLSVSNNSIVNY
jgi:type II secretory pathway pseudopilin PulG